MSDAATPSSAKPKESSGSEYRPDVVDTLFDECKRFFTREHATLLARAKPRPQTAQPIFVMGFPRSGASLIEQILGNHPSVAIGGELPFLGDLSRLASHIYPGTERFPAHLANSWLADYCYTATLFRDYYLARAEQYGLLKGSFTDATPFNEIYLPLVKMAFPKAKIIRIVRDPLGVSASMQANKVPNRLHCYKPEDIKHYLAAVQDLLEHYRQVLDLNDFTVRYEALVSEQAATTRKLLEYLELPVEDACLATKLKVTGY
jgi:hypothetical protein